MSGGTKFAQLRLKHISRELQLNRSLSAADWRQRKLLFWEISYDQDRTLQLRLAARRGDRRAGASGSVSLQGVPTPYWLGLWRQRLFPERAGGRRGAEQVYVRGSDSGRKIEQHFCLDCASTVFWYSESFPDLIGVAFGAFADPSMPWPPVSVWETTRHPWVTFDHELDHFGRQPELVEGPATARR